MKPCPHCGQSIQPAAIVCRHCKRDLDPAASSASVVVTTGDLRRDYDIIGPVYFQVSNKGIFSSSLSKLVKQYEAEISAMRTRGEMSGPRADWGFLWGEWSVGQTDFEKAFFVAVQELKKRAVLVGGDAVIGMRQDIDLDTTTFQYFYLQMYGTAVRIRDVPVAVNSGDALEDDFKG
jgi:hypothetical protein